VGDGDVHDFAVVRLDAENPARDIIRIEPATSANRKSAI